MPLPEGSESLIAFPSCDLSISCVLGDNWQEHHLHVNASPEQLPLPSRPLEYAAYPVELSFRSRTPQEARSDFIKMRMFIQPKISHRWCVHSGVFVMNQPPSEVQLVSPHYSLHLPVTSSEGSLAPQERLAVLPSACLSCRVLPTT